MIKSIFRFSTLAILFTVALVGLMAETADDANILGFILSKAIAFAAAYGFYKLYPRFVEKDKRVAKFDQWAASDIDKEI
jgi:hypothetical protein